MSTLKLVCERKICDLMPSHEPTERWEASGVLVKDRHYFVVFDDRREVARIADDLQPHDTNGLFGTAYADYGYEGSLIIPLSNGSICWSKQPGTNLATGSMTLCGCRGLRYKPYQREEGSQILVNSETRFDRPFLEGAVE
jgi:hypothetical protein